MILVFFSPYLRLATFEGFKMSSLNYISLRGFDFFLKFFVFFVPDYTRQTTFFLAPSHCAPVLETLSFYDNFPVLETLSFYDIFPVPETLSFYRFSLYLLLLNNPPLSFENFSLKKGGGLLSPKVPLCFSPIFFYMFAKYSCVFTISLIIPLPISLISFFLCCMVFI